MDIRDDIFDTLALNLNSLDFSNDLSNESLTNPLQISKYTSPLPLAHQTYFKFRSPKTLLIGITFYNEEAVELRRILVSLADQLDPLSVDYSILLVGDGYQAMSPCMSKYLGLLFFREETEIWNNLLNEFKESDDDSTYIIERNENIKILGAKDGLDRELDIKLMLKTHNRKKHNSHQWILNAFVPEMIDNPEKSFILLSDCGTTFEPGCIQKMLIYMQNHPLCGGCTGRQRVMTKEDQDMVDENIFSLGSFFRRVQQADYEATYVISTSAFSAFGCLSVLPGPCAMFRYSSLLNFKTLDIKDPLERLLFERPVQESVLQHFENLVATPSQQTSLTIENVKLAEDRIPSYSIVTHGTPGIYTTWVQGAVFNFQAETILKSWVFQRRRWINGAFMCYIWLLFDSSRLLLDSKHSVFRKYGIYFLFILTFFNYIFSILAPGIFGASVYIALSNLNSQLAILFIIFYTILLTTFVIVHKYKAFNQPLFALTILINAVGVIVVLFVYIRLLITQKFQPDNLIQLLIGIFILSTIFLPFVMALLALDFKSLLLLCFSAIPYFLFLPTLVGTFSIYSMTRLADTTWGNRKCNNENQAYGEHIENQASTIMVFSLLTNLILQYVLVFNYQNPYIMLTTIATLITPMVVQTLISIIYFGGKHLSKGCETR